MNEIAKNKKPSNMSNANYENICKLSPYTSNLKNFCESLLRNAK